ncbi:hypothetical protein BT96DRAFT_1012490 [Gymnopus androsaceus JB14]|uniref:Uncharacterized protein n=1 Tax=Gymnopus androsaceus JB14 TaxID=1447944 RepID=A0A6A4IM11_9AGAR|nr:hypothetical protein BT96DRAFT_1012490 [Gymnopus androsaceus JB14]
MLRIPSASVTRIHRQPQHHALQTPDDVPLVLKTLTGIALYARSLENELRRIGFHQMNFVANLDGGSEISGMETGTPAQPHTPLHDSSSRENRHDDWDTYMADVDEILRFLNSPS